MSGIVDAWCGPKPHVGGGATNLTSEVRARYSAPIFVDPEVSVPLGLADLAVQNYSYQGQTGWTALWDRLQAAAPQPPGLAALWDSLWAAQQPLYQQNPTLYNQMWTGFKE